MVTDVLSHLLQAYHILDLIALVVALLLRQWIRRLRARAGLTQERFAEWIGVEPRSVQRWEHGQRQPKKEYLLRMQILYRFVEANKVRL